MTEEPVGTLAPSPPGHAGFWRRLGAIALDSLLLGLLGQLLGYFWRQELATLGQAGRLLGFFIAALYFIPAHRLWGQTLGKKLLALRVQRMDGAPLSWSASSIRYLGVAVPWFANGLAFSGDRLPWPVLILLGVVFASVLFIGLFGNAYLLVFNRPSRRLIHDLLAGTVVVNARTERAPSDPGALRLATGHVAALLLIPVVILGGLGWIATRLNVTVQQIAQLRATQSSLDAPPDVLQASLTDKHQLGAGSKGHAIEIGLWTTQASEANNQTLARQAVGMVLATYPSSASAAGISVTVTWGYDIGIASFWRRVGATFSVDEWRRQIVPATRT